MGMHIRQSFRIANHSQDLIGIFVCYLQVILKNVAGDAVVSIGGRWEQTALKRVHCLTSQPVRWLAVREETRMSLESLIIFLLIGGIAGWLAGLVVKGGGFGIVGNIVVGIVGAFIAGFLFPALGFSLGAGIVGAIIHATIGAVILLLIVRVLKRA
jgi:uncharacterized membrane protein YeaQ/YmgE (transglycosylase-associated protein family)